MAVSYIDKFLEQNTTEEEIEEALRKVCSFLPDSMKEQVRRRSRRRLPPTLGFVLMRRLTYVPFSCVPSATSC